MPTAEQLETIQLTNGVTEVLTVKGFDTVDLVWQEGATAVLTLYDEAGAAITNASNLPMSEIAGDSPRFTVYRVEIPYTVTLPAGTFGTAVATFTNTANKRGKKTLRVEYL